MAIIDELLELIIEQFYQESLLIYYSDSEARRLFTVGRLMISQELNIEQKQQILKKSVQDAITFSFYSIIWLIKFYAAHQFYRDIEFIGACIYIFPIAERTKESFINCLVDVMNIPKLKMNSFGRPKIKFCPQLFLTSYRDQINDIYQMIYSPSSESIYLSVMNLLRFTICRFRIHFTLMDPEEQQTYIDQAV